jgi:hypothetical protein
MHARSRELFSRRIQRRSTYTTQLPAGCETRPAAYLTSFTIYGDTTHTLTRKVLSRRIHGTSISLLYLELRGGRNLRCVSHLAGCVWRPVDSVCACEPTAGTSAPVSFLNRKSRGSLCSSSRTAPVRDVLSDSCCALASRFMFFCSVREHAEKHLILEGTGALVLEAKHIRRFQTNQHTVWLSCWEAAS